MSATWKRFWCPPRKAAGSTSDIFREVRTPKAQWYADKSKERYDRRPDAILGERELLSGELGTYEGITFILSEAADRRDPLSASERAAVRKMDAAEGCEELIA